MDFLSGQGEGPQAASRGSSTPARRKRRRGIVYIQVENRLRMIVPYSFPLVMGNESTMDMYAGTM